MITPIEMYTMVPKSQEASNVHSAANAKNVAQQQGGMQEIAHQARHNTQQTVQVTSSENPEYRYDAKEQGNGNYSSNKKKKKKEDESEHKEDSSLNENHGGFDIRI
ncbi:MAG: hypothetical protein IKP88_00170 [Lachnospiraceae bacterium]|nr:hypothetical protein [Lachnospiraceae bacterium]